tara:strand:+ start:213 stop:419 length:207 start_codon:yes stop_codon:yes gene_type:complete
MSKIRLGEYEDPSEIKPGSYVRIKGTTFFCTVINVNGNKATLYDEEVSRIRTKKEPTNNLLIVDYYYG